MFARFAPARKAIGRVAGALALTALVACDAALLPDGGTGPSARAGEPVPVALLVPRSDPNAGNIARGLENAARLAIADLDGVEIDLRVYDTAGQSAVAAQVAQRAVDEGAGIILGPLFGEAANAAGVAVADEGVNVLSFSNNTQIAGGNVYVLGNTFENTAERLVSYGTRQGVDDIAVLYTDNVPGQVGRNAIQSAAARSGARIVAAEGYQLNTESLDAAIARVQPLVANGQAEGLFLTDDWQAGLSIALQRGPENGLTPDAVQYMGLTRWDARPDGFNLPGVEGAWFALPSRAATQAFESRYAATYGSAPVPLASLAFDGVAAIGALATRGRGNPFSARSLTQGSGFEGATGVFRLRPDGTNQRGLAVATVRNQQVVILDPAPRGFGGAGF